MAVHTILGALLKRLAAEQVRQTVADNLHRAAEENSKGPADAKSADRGQSKLLPCHVGVVCALPIELGHFEDRLAGVISVHGAGFTIRTGGLGGRGIAVVHSGPGRAAAERATKALIAGHGPRWVISAGFAGALWPELSRGDIVMADAVLGEKGERLSIDLKVSADEAKQVRSLHVGSLLTVDRILRTAAEKRALAQQHAALAVDMETLAVAQVCQREKRRFMAIRVISDALDDELPPEVERLLSKNSTAKKIGAAAGSIVRRPRMIKELWKLRESAMVAADRLAKFLEGVIAQLPS